MASKEKTTGDGVKVEAVAGSVPAPAPLRTGLTVKDIPYGLHLKGITTGYREGGTYFECLWPGLFQWHNQTLNSWTMIWGWMLSSWLLLWTLQRLQPRGADLAAFAALWLCPTLHLPFTVGYHQFVCISPEAMRRWRALDVAFIFIASIPLTFGLAYFVLPLPGALALTAASVGLSLHAWHNAAALPVGADIDKKANTRYVGLVVLVYLFPILLQAALDLRQALLPGLGLSGLSSLGGTAAGGVAAAAVAAPAHDLLYTPCCAAAIIFCFAYGGAAYVMSYPDVYAPGVFDMVGSAQQLMHIAISGAHGLEWLFVIHMYQRSHTMER